MIINCAAALWVGCGAPPPPKPDLDFATAASLPGRWEGPGGDFVLTAAGAFSRNFTEGPFEGTVLTGTWSGQVRKPGAASSGEITLSLSCGAGATVSATVVAQLRHEAADYVLVEVATVNGEALVNGLLPDPVAEAVTKDVPAGKKDAVRALVESLSASYLACDGCAGAAPAECR